ncbi:unnamed protein product [Choristocarpus tenellus]
MFGPHGCAAVMALISPALSWGLMPRFPDVFTQTRQQPRECQQCLGPIPDGACTLRTLCGGSRRQPPKANKLKSSEIGTPWWNTGTVVDALRATAQSTTPRVVAGIGTLNCPSSTGEGKAWFGNVCHGGAKGGNVTISDSSTSEVDCVERGTPFTGWTSFGGSPPPAQRGEFLGHLAVLVVWLPGLWGQYSGLLKSSPLLTKALTAGVIALLGDLVAQWFENHRSNRPLGPMVKDDKRLLAVAVDSMFFTGPGLHALYGVLERLVPTAGHGAVPAAVHVLVDTFMFDPIFVASFFCVTGFVEGRSFLRDILPNMKSREYWSAVRGTWAISLLFCPIQFFSFRYLPLQFRVMVVNLCDIGWTSVLSFFSHRARSTTTFN